MNPSSASFVDTNILIYAYDQAAGNKHLLARNLLQTLWASKTGLISTQVMQEFYVNATRKMARPLSPAAARSAIELYSAWEPIVIDMSMILRASEFQERLQLSFWDALIVASAERAGAETIYTEDMNHSQIVAGMRLVNPFQVD